MRYSPATIANYFLDKASQEGRALTPMQLLKLVYIAHGWHLGFRGTPLIDEPVQAWRYGPVIHSLYGKVKRFGSTAVTEPLSTGPFWERSPEVDDPQVVSILDNVWDGYGHFGGIQLSEMTHMKGSPWWYAWNEQGGSSAYHAVIDDKIIQRFYEKKIQGHRAGLYDARTDDRAQQRRFDCEAKAVAEHS
jgi:uncharacterized phage-associated protein